MTPLIADTDWGTIMGAAVAAFVTVATTLGGGVAWLLNWRAKQDEAQRTFTKEIMDRVENIAEEGKTTASNFQITLREVTKEFQDTARSLAKEQREETRQTVKTLLTIQGEAVEAVGGLAKQVEGLSKNTDHLASAMNDLRRELDKKADKPGIQISGS